MRQVLQPETKLDEALCGVHTEHTKFRSHFSHLRNLTVDAQGAVARPCEGTV